MKKAYTLYESITTIEGVKYYEISISEASFKEIKEIHAHLNDSTIYDKHYEAVFVSSLMLTEEEKTAVNTMIYACNHRVSYNDLKGGN